MNPAHILVICLTLTISSFADGRIGALVGNWREIKNLKEPHVIEIAEYAVKMHNRESKAALQFESVIKGETQVVAGTNYRLVIAANDGAGTSNNYEAVVWEKPWVGFRNLTSFKRV